jgi:hypothetical protein
VHEHKTPTYGVDGVGSNIGAMRNSLKISWPSGILYILSIGISVEREVTWGSNPRKLKTSRERGYMRILHEKVSQIIDETPTYQDSSAPLAFSVFSGLLDDANWYSIAPQSQGKNET